MENKNWFSKHVDTIVVLGGILSATLFMTSKINDLEKELAVIKTVLVVKGIYPNELCKADSDARKEK